MKFRLTRQPKHKRFDIIFFKKFLWFPKAIDGWWYWLEKVNVKREFDVGYPFWFWQLDRPIIYRDYFSPLSSEEKFNKKFNTWLNTK